MIFKGVARAEEHNGHMLHSAKLAIHAPSVIRLTEYIHIPFERRSLSRKNILLRDHSTCQYCGRPHPSHELTFDHVVPRSKGGTTVWSNVVTACGGCNLLKGNRLPKQSGLYPRQRPVQPTTFMLQDNGRAFPPNYLHESWRDYLYWDTELDPS